MKKIFLAAVFAFAFSQSSFAVTFADLIKQENNNNFVMAMAASFDGKETVNTRGNYESKVIEEKDVNWTEEHGENIQDYLTWDKDSDESHGWIFDGKYSNGGGTEHFIDELSEDFYQNDPGDECRMTRVRVYNDVNRSISQFYDRYTSMSCVKKSSGSGFKCQEKEKKAYYDEISDHITTIEEKDKCYE